MKLFAASLILYVIEWKILAMRYESKEDIHDMKVALSDHFIVGASNVRKTYIFYSIAGRSEKMSCIINNPSSELNIYGLTILQMKRTSILSFIQLSENKTSKSTVLTRATINLSMCDSTFYHTTIWNEDHQEHMFLKIDPQEKFAYIFADSFILSYELSVNRIDQISQTNALIFGNDYGSFIPYAFDLKNDWAAVAGFHSIQNNSYSRQCLYLFGLQPLRVINVSAIGINDIQGPDRSGYHQDYDMSLAINPSGTTLAIGEVQMNKVTIAYIEKDNNSRFVSKFHQISEPENWNGFGRSVVWLNDDETLVVLVLKSNGHNSSESEVQIYKNIFRNRTRGSITPSFVIPNNQQTLDGIQRSKSWRKHSFRRIRTRSKNLLILLRNGDIVYIPSSNAGFCSMQLESILDLNLFILQPVPCVSGSFKNVSGPGPCTICPPGTKNSGITPAKICQSCHRKAFCPLGATGEINLTHFNSYIQTYSYPDSPIIDDYDDLLLLNFFPTTMRFNCFISTPLFWTILATIVCLLIWLIMFLIKRRRPTSVDLYRQRAKNIFKHTDLIGEGERWIGGLASVVIFTIIIYSSIFAGFYFYSYPIETTETVDKACDNSKRNSKFDNALQLPLRGTDGTYWKIFDLLDQQPFIMAIHLINTRAECDNITVERNRRTGTPLSMVETNCTLEANNVTSSFSFSLPTHKSSVRVGINGPYFIGALRLCIRGKSATENEDSAVHRLHELDLCTLFYTNNQTIGLSTSFTVRLIKVINVTKPLKRNDITQYDGRWSPFITYNDILSDESYFAEKGDYLRYSSKQTIIHIRLAEEIYFVQNNQSPIIRRGALFFHTVLFSFSLIEIFAMVFLLYKLWLQPLRRRIIIPDNHGHDDECQSNRTQISIDVSSFLDPEISQNQLICLCFSYIHIKHPYPNYKLKIVDFVNLGVGIAIAI